MANIDQNVKHKGKSIKPKAFLAVQPTHPLPSDLSH